MKKRTKVIRDKVNKMSEQEAKRLLANIIDLINTDSFSDPTFNPNRLNMDDSQKIIGVNY